jgi:hypothetical protein
MNEWLAVTGGWQMSSAGLQESVSGVNAACSAAATTPARQLNQSFSYAGIADKFAPNPHSTRLQP